MGMTVNEAAELLGIAPSTLRTQIARGKLHAVKHGRDWYITRSEVDRYQAEHRQAPR